MASTISTVVSELSNEVARGDEVWRLFAGITTRLRQLEGQPKPIDGPRLLEDLQAAAEQNRCEPDNKLFFNRIGTLVVREERRTKSLQRDAFAKAPTSFFDFFFDPLDGLFP